MSTAEKTADGPRQVGSYLLLEEIGSGAMGKVYRARHKTLDNEVALKILHEEMSDPHGEVRERFLQEGVAASRVRHPNVVQILDAGVDGDTAFMAMQLLDGETLADCISRQGRLPLTYAVDLILPVCAALGAAHDAGVLHRDLKPANIFLRDVGRGDPDPMLLDFGISKILGPVDAELTQNPKFLGTPLYIAPEQADGAPGSTYSDQYSLALTFYEVFLGVRPFEKYRSSLMQLLRHVAEGDIIPANELDPSIPPDLDRAICRALATNPQDRFPSVREFAAALLPYASAARQTLWQHSFVDAERTMNSANLPIGSSRSSRSSRRIAVSVATTPQPPQVAAPASVDEPHQPVGQGDFISHSLLFNQEDDNYEASSNYDKDDVFEGDQSAVSCKEEGVVNRGEGDAVMDRITRPAQNYDPYCQPPSSRDGGFESSAPPGPSYLTHDRYRGSSRPPPSAPRPVTAFSWFIAGLIVITGFVGTFILFTNNPIVNDGESYGVAVRVSPREANIELDDHLVATGSFKGSFGKTGEVHRLRITLRGYDPVSVVFQDQAPPQHIQLNHSKDSQGAPRAPLHDSNRNGANRTLSRSQAQVDVRSTTRETLPTFPLKNKPTLHDKKPRKENEFKKSQKIVPPRDASSQDAAPQSKSKSNMQGAPASEKAASPQQKAERPSKASIRTGNLDPWAP